MNAPAPTVRLPVALTVIGAAVGALLVLAMTPLSGWVGSAPGIALIQGLAVVWLVASLVVDVRGWKQYSDSRRTTARLTWTVLAGLTVWPLVFG